MADRPLRIGTLGAAAITPAALIRPARETPEVSVTAVAARDQARAEAFAAKHRLPTVYSSYAELIADPDIDAVYVPLPNGLHGCWAIDALAAGKHVLCEKPLAANAVEAAQMAEAAARADRVLMEAFHWRYHPLAKQMLEVVASGDLGTIEHVSAAFCFPLRKRRDIRWQLGLAGGALMDVGCYPVNMVRAVAHAAGAGEPQVTGAKATMTAGGVDRALTGTMRFDDGPTSSIVCSLLSRHIVDIRLRVVGSRGKLGVLNPLAPHLFGRMRWSVDGQRYTAKPVRTATYTYQLRAFAAAVNEGEPFPTTAADGVANMTVIDDLLRAAGQQPYQPTLRSAT